VVQATRDEHAGNRHHADEERAEIEIDHGGPPEARMGA
jgi:hypothetical protein